MMYVNQLIDTNKYRTLNRKLYDDSKKNRIFKNLIELMVDDNNIIMAIDKLRYNKGSKTPGVDGITIDHYINMNVMNMIRIVKNKFRNFNSKPVKRIYIPKPNGDKRPLGIPCMIDRIIQQCILQILEPICEAKFNCHSYGFRPGRSAENAIAEFERMAQLSKLHFVANIDIKGFFDHVNHKKLLRQIWSLGIRDSRLQMILKRMLKSKIIDGNEELSLDEGIPQGGVISPLLANIVLNELDWWVFSQWEGQCDRMKNPIVQGVNKRNNGRTKGNEYRSLRRSRLKEVYMVRYADDFKLLCRDRDTADTIYESVKLWLKDRLKLEVSESKSGVIDLTKSKSNFLGLDISLKHKRSKYVISSHMSQKAITECSNKLTDIMKRIQHESGDKRMKMVHLYNITVMGMHNYYQMATEVAKDFDKISYRIKRIMNNRICVSKVGNNTGIVSKLPSKYSKSKQVRYINGMPIIPCGYIRTKAPLSIGAKANLYDDDNSIYQKLDYTFGLVSNKSTEYNSNRLAIFVNQNGLDYVTHKRILLGKVHCHHKIPISMGGNDALDNLIIVGQDVHKLIHSSKLTTMRKLLDKLQLTEDQVAKVNKLRSKCKLNDISLAEVYTE